MRIRPIAIAALSLGLLVGAMPPVRAEEPRMRCPICGRITNQQAGYSQRAGATLARGVLNTAFGWTELLVEPTAEVNAHGNLVVGVGKGIGYAVTRTALGIGELLTFWAPKDGKNTVPLVTDCPICFPATKQHVPAPTKPPS